MQAPEAAKPGSCRRCPSTAARRGAARRGIVASRPPPARARWPARGRAVARDPRLRADGAPQRLALLPGRRPDLATDDRLAARRTASSPPTTSATAGRCCSRRSCAARARASSTRMPRDHRCFNVLVLGPLALWAIYGLGARIAGRAFGLFAAAVWVVLPFAVIPLWRAATTTSATSSSSCRGALGLTGLADYQSMVLLLVGRAALHARARDPRHARRHRRRARGRLRRRRQAVERSLRRRAVRRGPARAQPAAAAAVRPRAAARAADPGGVEAARARLAAGVRASRRRGSPPAPWSPSAFPTSTATSTSTGPTCTTTSTTCASTSGARACSSARRSPAPSRSRAARRRWPRCSRPGSASSSSSRARRRSRRSRRGSFFRFLMPGFPAYFLLVVSILLLVPTLGAYLRRDVAGAAARALSTAGVVIGLAIVPRAAAARRRRARPADGTAAEGGRRRRRS